MASRNRFFFSGTSSASLLERWKRCSLSYSLKSPLDQVKVLGDEHSGHTGCVNALSWTTDGEFLLTGGDDRTVRFWSLENGDISTEYPFKCKGLIHTGHRANIFNAQMLPCSARLATVAGDREVRVFDVESVFSLSASNTDMITHSACSRVLRCHSGRCKRIVTEYSPDLFLTVAEDGCVRQHDLRTSHACRSACPPPLIKLRHSLSTLALSPLTPYQFVVAGRSPYGYLFDRRHAGRILQEEWGRVPEASGDDVATCVRRFGRPSKPSKASGDRSEHVTGARMSKVNGHEVLLSYSGDAVYLYSTYDAPSERPSTSTGSLQQDTENNAGAGLDESQSDSESSRNQDAVSESGDGGAKDDESTPHHPKVPVVLPRERFVGACNVDTVKDVNFLGPDDEYIASGSDDGNFFLWKRGFEKAVGVYVGDGSVVNVIEAHPYLPLVAVSGIDTTVKLFAPIHEGTSHSSMINELDDIVRLNSEASQRNRIPTFAITQLLFPDLFYAMLGRTLSPESDES